MGIGRCMTMPDFIIVGAPKCGTTSLYGYLRSHPQVYLSPIKEPNYFCLDEPRLRFADTPTQYAALFAGATPGQVRGEGSTAYLFSRVAATEMLKANPRVKLIAMVRNPLEMVVSYHAQKVYSFEESELDFATAWQLSPLRAQGRHVSKDCRAPRYMDYKSIGRLGEQLRRLKDLVPEQQLHVIVFDDLKSDPSSVFRHVLQYLELSPHALQNFQTENARKRHGFPRIARILMRPPPLLRHLKKSVRRLYPEHANWLGAKFHRVNQRRRHSTVLPDQLRSEMLAEFGEDIALLASMLNRDLSHWSYSFRSDALSP
jgi:hypothetical protein